MRSAKTIGRMIGFVVVPLRLDTYIGNKRRTKLILSCEKTGKYKSWKKTPSPKTFVSRKCDYPFKLRAEPLKIMVDGLSMYCVDFTTTT